MTAVIKALAALAQSSRLEVFRSLVVAGDLKELVHADLVTQERVGRNLVYRAQYGRMNAVLAYLKVLKLRLIATFVGVVATGILLVGYVFNAVL